MSKSTSSAKKATAGKATAKNAGHPSYIHMVQEAIIAHPEDARFGVSRPIIKKFIENKYKVDINSASSTTQLSRAIITGVEKGIFILPKGLSGKVKLAPKAKADFNKEQKTHTDTKIKSSAAKAKPVKSSSSTKENKKPGPAKAASHKAKPAAAKAASTKPKPKAAKPANSSKSATKSATKPATKKQTTTKAKPVAKKPSTSASKKDSAKAAAVKRQKATKTAKPAKTSKSGAPKPSAKA